MFRSEFSLVHKCVFVFNSSFIFFFVFLLPQSSTFTTISSALTAAISDALELCDMSDVFTFDNDVQLLLSLVLPSHILLTCLSQLSTV